VDDPGSFDVRRAVLVAVLATIVLVVAGAVAYRMNGDVPRDLRMFGVDLGGLSRGEAEEALRGPVAEHAATPVRVRLDGRRLSFRPDVLGVAVDVALSVGRAIRGQARPVVRVDKARFGAELRRYLAAGRVTMRKPGITFFGLVPRPSYPAAGLDLDLDLAVRAVREAWPRGAEADVPLVRRTPETTAAGVDELIARVARPAVTTPMTVRAGQRTFRLPPAAIARGLVFRADEAGRLTPVFDGFRLRAAARRQFATVETAPRPARIRIIGGRPRIVAGADGELVDVGRLGADLLRAPHLLQAPGRRREVRAVLCRVPAPVTGRDLAGLGIRERVSTFTTYFTGGRGTPRSRHIITIARAVDGAIVRPGATFSLNAHTGARNHAAGYREAPVIVGGRLEPGVGGGASQFTTTLFNAAYYAGLEDVEHKPHSFYFARYPAVIESTIFYPSLDLKFRDNTPYGILIDTATTGRSVTVTLWSTRVFDRVTTEYGPRRHRTAAPTVRRRAGPRCLTSSGLPGFTQDAWRVIRKDGREVERRKFTWRYDPEPRFVCAA